MERLASDLVRQDRGGVGRAEALVEAFGGGVAGFDFPEHGVAVAFFGEGGEEGHGAGAEAAAAVLGADDDVFEAEDALTGEGGDALEEPGVTDRGVVARAVVGVEEDAAFGGGAFAEEGGVDVVGCGGDRAGAAFGLGEGFEVGEDELGVFGGGRADGECGRLFGCCLAVHVFMIREGSANPPVAELFEGSAVS